MVPIPSFCTAKDLRHLSKCVFITRQHTQPALRTSVKRISSLAQALKLAGQNGKHSSDLNNVQILEALASISQISVPNVCKPAAPSETLWVMRLEVE